MKHGLPDVLGKTDLSRPSRARGLKLVPNHAEFIRRDVAPLADAWIETIKDETYYTIEDRRAPRGRVD